METAFLRVGCATPTIRVGDCAHNAAAAAKLLLEAEQNGVQLLCLPALCLCGSSCGDLFFQSTLIEGAKQALCSLLDASKGFSGLAFVGLPVLHQGRLYNCAAAVQGGALLGLVAKSRLSAGEARYFSSASTLEPGAQVPLFGAQVPLAAQLLFACKESPDLLVAPVLEDGPFSSEPPSSALARAGALVLLNLSAHIELIGSSARRRLLVQSRSADSLCAYALCGAGEGESSTDFVFSGSRLIASNGALLAESTAFTSGLTHALLPLAPLLLERRKQGDFYAASAPLRLPFSLKTAAAPKKGELRAHPFIPQEQQALAARCHSVLAMQAKGLQTRLQAVGLQKVILGLSGGLDSTLALLVASACFKNMGLPPQNIIGVTMPCFGTTSRTFDNALALGRALGITQRNIPLADAVSAHLRDIDHPEGLTDATYENAQARERTQVLMDLANQQNALMLGTGDLSELALGFATYNGDHMAMYGLNGSVPKTLIRHIVRCVAEGSQEALKAPLLDIVNTPVSPELLPPIEGQMQQITEDLVGPYELHDFFLFHMMQSAPLPKDLLLLACSAFEGRFLRSELLAWMGVFYRRFFASQFKRSCLCDGPKVGRVSLSPRGDFCLPSDASSALLLEALKQLEQAP